MARPVEEMGWIHRVILRHPVWGAILAGLLVGGVMLASGTSPVVTAVVTVLVTAVYLAMTLFAVREARRVGGMPPEGP